MTYSANNLLRAYEILNLSHLAHLQLNYTIAFIKSHQQMQAWQALTNASLLLKESQNKGRQMILSPNEVPQAIRSLLLKSSQSNHSAQIALELLESQIRAMPILP